MRNGTISAALFSAAALATSLGGAGCTSHDSTDAANGKSAPEVRQGKAMVKEAEKMEGHGQQLKVQGDETGGQQLIEQSKIKAAQGEQMIEKAPATRPSP